MQFTLIDHDSPLFSNSINRAQVAPLIRGWKKQFNTETVGQ